MLTLTDLFCGAGGSSSGAIQVPGVSVRMAANHWKLAVETHNTNHPDADHDCADISQTDPRRYPTTDILWASPECFPAGTLVTTTRGQVPIEDVEIGDLVLTHTGQWRPVVRTQNRTADTVIVRGQGHPGLEVTPNHRLWARSSELVWKGRREQYKREYAEPEWVRADELLDRQALWATPVSFEPLPVADPPAAFGLDLTAAWWLVGRWVGDGSLGTDDSAVVITCGNHEADALAERLADTGTDWARYQKRTAVSFAIYQPKVRNWLREHFGHGAANKGLPSFAYAMPRAHRSALLDGYLSADGGFTQRRVRSSTVSRRLGVSVRLLAESLGHRVSVGTDRRTSYLIEGRTGVALPQWINHWEPALDRRRAPEAWTDDLHAWSRVRAVASGRTGVTVYNIEVGEDHSYVADGLVVMNCTNHSQAKGQRRSDRQPDLFGQSLPDEAAERSRSTMWDVCRFVEAMKLRGHPYKAFVVENVVDVRQWMFFDAWVMALRSAGYCMHFVYMNSMFAQGAGAPAPQSRDRWYAVGHLAGNRCPDLNRWVQPKAWCPKCEASVRAVQVWKRPESPWGRYRAQYVWHCPTPACRIEVHPGVLPAAVAIDWDLAGERIGDRARPLALKTVARIEAGLRRYSSDRFITIHRGGPDELRTTPIGSPLPTLTASGNHLGAVVPPMLVPAGGTWNDSGTPVTEPFRTRTTRDTEALVVPVEGREGIAARLAADPARTQTARLQDALVVPMRAKNTAKLAELAPLDTVTTSGGHHALVMRNNTARGDQGQMSTPTNEPLRTLLAEGRQSLIRWDHMLVPYYGTGTARPVGEPSGTVTTVDRNALVSAAVAVDDCTFRMLEPHEIQAAMAFGAEYVVLGNKRERVRQLGNAVTPPAARDLIAALAESITGESIEVAA
jgi:DNA (cytosine-5)-methyltransferase 1